MQRMLFFHQYNLEIPVKDPFKLLYMVFKQTYSTSNQFLIKITMHKYIINIIAPRHIHTCLETLDTCSCLITVWYWLLGWSTKTDFCSSLICRCSDLVSKSINAEDLLKANVSKS